MIEIATIIPSWDYQRALSLVRALSHLELRKRAEYIIVIPSIETAYDLQPDLLEWLETDSPEGMQIVETDQYLSPVEAMALGARSISSDIGVLAFLHDDMQITFPYWDRDVLSHFDLHPRCGLVGFGGGIGFADIDIYKVPYDYRQLARVDFVSNMREAESHGRRVSEPMRVAALDGFALITSREFYMQAGDRLIWQNPPLTDPPSVGAPKLVDSNGAWEVCLKDGVPYHMYDAWLSCRAAELGYETWMLPVACHHQGGQTSVGRQTEYAQVVKRLGYASAEELYAKGHEAIYRRFSGVLPIRVGSTT